MKEELPQIRDIKRAHARGSIKEIESILVICALYQTSIMFAAVDHIITTYTVRALLFQVVVITSSSSSRLQYIQE